MRCGYLYQFRLAGAGFSVESCTACRSPYVPSISELHDYCRGKEYRKCPVLLEKERSADEANPAGVHVYLDF